MLRWKGSNLLVLPQPPVNSRVLYHSGTPEYLVSREGFAPSSPNGLELGIFVKLPADSWLRVLNSNQRLRVMNPARNHSSNPQFVFTPRAEFNCTESNRSCYKPIRARASITLTIYFLRLSRIYLSALGVNTKSMIPSK